MIAPLRHARLIERHAVNKAGSLEEINDGSGNYRTKARRRQTTPAVRNLSNTEGHNEKFPVKSPVETRTDESFGEATHS
jgi:hypothetical protein